MAEPKRVPVELSDFLFDLDPVGLKGLASAPILYRADRLLDAIHRRYGIVKDSELVSALIHHTPPDETELAEIIENYRNDQVFQLRRELGERTPESGIWEIEIRGVGQRQRGKR